MRSGSRIVQLSLTSVIVCLFAIGIHGQDGYLPPPSINCQEPYGCSGPGIFVNPNNCNSFYWCIYVDGQEHYKAEVFKCGQNLWFDERQQVCNWPDDVSPVPRCAACWDQIIQEYPETG